MIINRKAKSSVCGNKVDRDPKVSFFVQTRGTVCWVGSRRSEFKRQIRLHCPALKPIVHTLQFSLALKQK